ncbi:MAG TPA: recombinase family protein [Oscillospiraceae bacterium]|nr:recombinase family protein [Oscillospiraceae bacterium]
MGSETQVAIYCRLSREDGDNIQSNSIKTQKLIIENYCKRQGWNVFETYIDDGFSGTNFERPGFQKMYQDIVDAKVNVVITKDLSRLGRNYIFTGYYYQVFFPQAGVRYIAINDHIDTDSVDNDMTMAAFKNILNDMYTKNLSKNMIASRKIRFENKINCNSIAPYGYKFNIDRVLVPDPDYVPIVRYIFEEYIKDPVIAHIADKLNAQGIPSPSFRLLKDKNYQDGSTSTKWNTTTPGLIIQNVTYLGALSIAKSRKIGPYSKKRVAIPLSEQTIVYNCHEAIIPKEMWEKANKLRSSNRTAKDKACKKSIFNGYVFCAHCGKHLSIHSHSVCNCWRLGSKKGIPAILNKSISNRLVADIHALAIECEKNEDTAYALIKSYLENVDHSDNADLAVQIVCIQSRIEKLNNKITQIELFNKDHTFSSTESERIFAALKSSLSIEVDKIKNLKASYIVIPSDKDIWRFIKAARRFGYLKKIDREALEELVDKIYIAKKENVSRSQQQRITIKFKYIGVISTSPLTRNGVLIRPDIGTNK